MDTGGRRRCGRVNVGTWYRILGCAGRWRRDADLEIRTAGSSAFDRALLARDSELVETSLSL